MIESDDDENSGLQRKSVHLTLTCPYAVYSRAKHQQDTLNKLQLQSDIPSLENSEDESDDNIGTKESDDYQQSGL